MKKYLVMFAAILLCLVIGGAPFAVAQDEEGGEFTLEEITVTAQKRAENQQKVPIAMEVISGEDLGAMGKNDLDEILKDVANIEIATANTGTRINIRGLVDDGGTFGDDGLNLQSSMVAMNIDGAFTTNQTMGDSLFDLERVEVLMGPQSTMYGANSPGGIVNIVTAAPKTDKFSAHATVEYGSYDKLNLQGALNVPVIQDTLALRVAANNNKQGTWVEGDPTSETTAVRLKTLWSVYEDLDFTVTGNWSKKSGGGMIGGRVVPFMNQSDVDNPWTLYNDTSLTASLFDQTNRGISAELSWSLPFADLSLVPSYTESEANGDSVDNFGNDYYQVRESFQRVYEARMTNPADFELFQWIVGYSYSLYEQDVAQEYANPAQNRGRWVHQEKSAVYGNITYPLPFYDRLRLTAGYRQSWDESYGYEEGRGQEGEWARKSTPNYKVGAEYDVSDSMMFYGNFSSSYRSKPAFGRPINGEWPENEKLNAYTAGLKSRYLDNRLQVNLNVYFYDYTNKYCVGFIQADVTEDQLYPGPVDGITPIEPYTPNRPGPPPQPVTYQVNEDADPSDEHYVEPDGINPSLDVWDANGNGIYDEPFVYTISDDNANGIGTFNSLGIDLQTTWLITSKDRLNLSIAYLDSTWEDLEFNYYYSMANEDTGFQDEYPDFRYDVFQPRSFKNVSPPNSPKWGVTASYQHIFTLGALGSLTPQINMKYKSKYDIRGAWDDWMAGYPYRHQEAYTIWDASATFAHSSGRWTLSGYAKNITNYASKTQLYITGGGRIEMRISDPRTYGVTLSYRFF